MGEIHIHPRPDLSEITETVYRGLLQLRKKGIAMNGPLDLHPKVAGGGLSASLALIILWTISHWVIVPPEVAAAFTALLGFVGAWLSPIIPAAPAAAAKSAK